MPRSADIPILLRLSEACNVHRSYHNENPPKKDEKDNEAIPERCRKDLKSLGSILPRVEETYSYEKCSVSDASHLCSFYKTIIQRGFCPHALILFDSGKRGKLIFPRAFHLLKFLLYPPLLQSLLTQSNDTNDSNFNKDKTKEPMETFHQIQHTIANLLNLVPETNIQHQIWYDLVVLLQDLEIVHQAMSAQLRSTQHVSLPQNHNQLHSIKVQLFATASSSKDYFLDIPDLQSLHSLQCSVFSTLNRLLEFSIDNQIDSIFNLSTDSSFTSTLTLSLLQSIKSVLLLKDFDGNNNKNTESKYAFQIKMQNKICAIKLLYFLMNKNPISSSKYISSFSIKQSIPMIVHMICNAIKILLETIHLQRNLDLNSSSPTLLRSDEYAIILWQILRDIFLFPSPLLHSIDRSFSSIRNTSLFILLDCVPYISSNVPLSTPTSSSGLYPSEKKLMKGVLRCIFSILTHVVPSTIINAKSYCITHSLFRPLLSLLKESQFGGIVSHVSSLLLRNDFSYMEQVSHAALLRSSEIITDDSVTANHENKNLTGSSQKLSPKRTASDQVDSTPLSQHKRRRIDFNSHQKSQSMRHTTAPTEFARNQPQMPYSEYCSLSSSLHQAIDNAIHFSDKICKYAGSDLNFKYDDSNGFSGDISTEFHPENHQNLHLILTAITSRNCAEITGILRFFLLCTDYIFVYPIKHEQASQNKTKASHVIIERLLTTMSIMSDAIIYEILNAEKQEPYHGPKRLRKIMGSFVSLAFHGYFQYKRVASYKQKIGVATKSCQTEPSIDASANPRHDNLVEDNNKKQNGKKFDLFYRTLQKIAYCSLMVLGSTNDTESELFLDSLDEVLSTKSSTRESDGLSQHCTGLCHKFCSILGMRRQHESSIFCMCGLIQKKKLNWNDELGSSEGTEYDLSLEEISCSFLETSLPLNARSILLSCLIPITSSDETNRFCYGDYSIHDTLSIFYDIVKSPTTSPSITTCILGGFPVLIIALFTHHYAAFADKKHKRATDFLTNTLQDWKHLILARTDDPIASSRRVAFITMASLTEVLNLNRERRLQRASCYWIDHASSIITTFSNIANSKDEHNSLFELYSLPIKNSLNKKEDILNIDVYELLLSSISKSSFGCDASSSVRFSSYKFFARAAMSCSIWDLRNTEAYCFFPQMRSSKERAEESMESITNHSLSTFHNENPKRDGISMPSIPPLVWIFYAAFVDPDKTVRQYAARNLGLILLGNESRLLFSLFLTKTEWDYWENKHDERKLATPLLTRFFQEIETLMFKFCSVPPTQLSYTMGGGTAQTTTGASSNSTFSDSTTGSTITYQYSALCALSSLCEHADVNRITGALIFEGALRRIIRFWLTKKRNNSPSIEKLSVLAFTELRRLHKIRPFSHMIVQRNTSFLTSLFSEMLMPSFAEGISGHPERFHHLHVFINDFIIQSSHRKISDSFGVSALEYIEATLPIVVPALIIEKDFDTLRMTTGFWLFLKSKKRREEKSGKIGISPTIFRSRRLNTIGVKRLSEDTKHMCISPRLLQHIIPKLLLHPERGPLIFFLKTVVNTELNIKDLFTAVQDLVLKNLIWELGAAELNGNSDSSKRSEYRKNDVLMALKKGSLLWTQKKVTARQRNEDGKARSKGKSQEIRRYNSIDGVDAMHTDAGKEIGNQAAASWITDRFMYLMVNIVNMKLRDNCDEDILRALNCLRLMLSFLEPNEAPQYLPQIMSVVDTTMCKASTGLISFSSKMRFEAVRILSQFVKITLECQVKTIGANLTSIVVALFPVLEGSHTYQTNNTSGFDFFASEATKEAVELLEWMINERNGRVIAPFFRDIPFLPLSPLLDPFRAALKNYGVDVNNLLMLTQWNTQNPLGTANSEGESSGVQSAQSQHALQHRLQVLCKMMSHENVSVRNVVIHHLIDLLRSNRCLFQRLVENEEAESMRFLTVVNEIAPDNKVGGTQRNKNSSSSNMDSYDKYADDNKTKRSGSVAMLIQSLQLRCVVESEIDTKIAVATALGEIGAIDPNRLGGSLREVSSSGHELEPADNSIVWRWSQPPWKSQIVRYELQLVTNQLSVALKASPTAMDQHKISFAIQELLILLNEFANQNSTDGGNKIDDKENGSEDDEETLSELAKKEKKKEMNPWLISQLERASVLELVEPFWSTKYQQRNENVAFRNPPFFKKAISYHGWLSHWCRFMIKQTITNDRSRWRHMFHACRAAIRSPAGSTVAEFLLPLLILDMMCFGDEKDEEITIQELKDALSYRPIDVSHKMNPSHSDNFSKNTSIPCMNSNDLQKTLSTIFTTLDTLQIWAERETEERYKSARGGTGKNQISSLSLAKSVINRNEKVCTIWPSDESIARINDLLSSLPLSNCAEAAAEAGMHARSLRYLELEARQQVVEKIYDDTTCDDSHDDLGRNELAHSFLFSGPGRALTPLRHINLELVQKLLGRLNESDAMTAIARERERIGLSHDILDLIHEREVVGDWNGALQGYEQALQLRQHVNNRTETSTTSQRLILLEKQLLYEKGMCRCLLELGQLESVSNQVIGILNKGIYGKQKFHSHDYSAIYKRAEVELLPSATEAAWRLGRWSLLDKLVKDKHTNSSRLNGVYEAESAYHINLGQAFLGLHRRHASEVSNAIRSARTAIMTSLASVARETYPRFYPYLLRLHCLREIENASEVICSESKEGKIENTYANFADYVGSDSPLKWHWDGRLRMAAPELAGSSEICNVRLALSRIAKEPYIEGKIWLSMGKSARKAGLLDISQTAFAHAEGSFATLKKHMIKTDESLDFNETSITDLQNQIQLQLAKSKHTTGESSTALQMMNMEDLNVKDLLMQDEINTQKAILLWLNRQRNSDLPGLLLVNQSEEQLKGHMNAFGRRLLQATEWIVEGGLKSGPEVTDRYKLVQQVCPNWERAHFKFARYLDSLLEARILALAGQHQHLSHHDDDEVRSEILQTDSSCQLYLLSAMKEYGKALELGEKHLYQLVPRLLTIWFDFNSINKMEDTTESSSIPDETEQKFKNKQEEANCIMAGLIRTVSPRSYYIALPQLISRVGHSDNDTVDIVKAILKRVLVKFPRHAMWHLAWLRHSADSMRQDCGDEIFNGAQRKLNKRDGNRAHDLLVASKSLFKYLIDLAKYVPKNSNARNFHVKKWSGEVPLHEFLPPVQAALSLAQNSVGVSSNIDAYPSFVPRMRAFSSQVGVMSSKARPKKLTAFAIPAGQRNKKLDFPGKSASLPQPTDAGEMHFLVKQEAKGDLRKDARVQDLNNVINRLLAGSAPSDGNLRRQRRRLHLRTFSVVCLSEETGILEWVPNTDSFRNLVTLAYNPQAAPHSVRRRGKRLANFSDASLRNTFQACQDQYIKNGNLLEAASMFEEKCLKEYPPVLYWWFVQRFLDPHAWFEARTRFSLSAAVWSAVGHVIGLGDRHSENILVDTSCGDCVHVDFDCIFDKGLTLPRPEVVPFRLTQNMIDAFGPTGYEGTFRGGVMSAMSTLRTNRDTLLSVLEPFVKDPVIDWKKMRAQQKQGKSKINSGENNDEAKRSMKVIEGRIRGVYNLRNPNLKKIRRTDGYSTVEDDSNILPLSVEGQVNRMINEATSHENLVQLYVGWMPWV